jgi:hypothetical protein
MLDKEQMLKILMERAEGYGVRKPHFTPDEAAVFGCNGHEEVLKLLRITKGRLVYNDQRGHRPVPERELAAAMEMLDLGSFTWATQDRAKREEAAKRFVRWWPRRAAQRGILLIVHEICRRAALVRV